MYIDKDHSPALLLLKINNRSEIFRFHFIISISKIHLESLVLHLFTQTISMMNPENFIGIFYEKVFEIDKKLERKIRFDGYKLVLLSLIVSFQLIQFVLILFSLGQS